MEGRAGLPGPAVAVSPGEGREDALAFSSPGGPGGVLLLHGFTGSPASMRPLAEAFAAAGFAVELPLLPGHGTALSDLEATGFSDWVGAAGAALSGLSERVAKVVVCGHSMGGTLALALAAARRDVSGLVLVNPFLEPVAPDTMKLLEAALAAGSSTIPSIGSDLKRPGRDGAGYDATPIRPLLSLWAAIPAVLDAVGSVTCPVLLFSSRVDHVVPPSSSDRVERQVAGPLERVYLEDSYHLAMLDADGPEIERRAVAFAQKVVA